MRRRYLSALVLTFAFALYANAQDRAIVWQIGEFNSSAYEFGSQAAGVFDAATGQAKDWGGTQQAVVESKADASASRRIRFDLAEAPGGVYTLRLGLILNSPRVPVVQLEVNGHKGWFYQRPERDFKEGNLEANIFPQYAVGTLEAGIPAEFLKRGANEIALTAIADPHASALPGGEDTTDSLLRYDALALVREAGGAAAAPLSAEATPTVLYKREAGRLHEIVHVTVRWSGTRPSGHVTLTPGDYWSRKLPLASGRAFGGERFEFLMPEFTPGSRSRVGVREI